MSTNVILETFDPNNEVKCLFNFSIVSWNLDNLLATLSLKMGILRYVILSLSYAIKYLQYSMTTSMSTACMTAQFAYAELQYLHKASKIWDIHRHPLTSSQKIRKVCQKVFYQGVTRDFFAFLCFMNNLWFLYLGTWNYKNSWKIEKTAPTYQSLKVLITCIIFFSLYINVFTW